MKIVVTGALGHIGSKLIRELPTFFPNPEIILIDNLSTQRYSSLYHLPEVANYSFYEEDILSMRFAKTFKGADAVIHLAALTDGAASLEMEEKTQEVNVLGTERVALACAEQEVPLIFPSTTSVYGESEGEIGEECSPDPGNPYSESKILAEKVLEKMGKGRGLRYTICRMGTIFGTSAGMRFHTAVNRFCWQAMQSKPLTIWETAWEQSRPYLDLDDAIRAYAFILKNSLFDDEIYHLVTLNATVKEIVNQIKEEVPDLLYRFVSSEIMNSSSHVVSNKRFSELGFEFNGNLKKAIHETVAMLKSTSGLPTTLSI